MAQTQDLLEVAAELCALLCLLSGDVGRYGAADAYGYVSWTCAEEANSDLARALALSAQSKTARWEGRLVEAAELASRGFDLCPQISARVLLGCQEANARQALGDIAGAQQALMRAHATRDKAAGDEAAEAWTCPRARQANYALQVALGAGNTVAVRRAAHDADSAWAAGDPWVYGTWAQVRIGTGIACVLDSDVEAAVEELNPVLRIAPPYRVLTITGRIGEVARRLGQSRYVGSPSAASLREQIADFQSGSLEHCRQAQYELS